MIRRKKSEVLRDLPAKRRTAIVSKVLSREINNLVRSVALDSCVKLDRWLCLHIPHLLEKQGVVYPEGSGMGKACLRLSAVGWMWGWEVVDRQPRS